jgi:hypothetical protein
MKEEAEVKTISRSPFMKTESDEGPVWEFVANLPDGSELEACIHPAALFASLEKGSGEDSLLVCGCSDAGCAGFWHESFEWGDGWIEWRVKMTGRTVIWRFDRDAYESGAIRMLREIHDSRQGWEFCFYWYPSFEEFEQAVERFLASNPRFQEMWEKSGGVAG